MLEFSLRIKGLEPAQVVELGPEEGLNLEVTVVNDGAQRDRASIALRLIDLFDREIWNHQPAGGFPPGKSVLSCRLLDQPDAPQEGMFVVQVVDRDSGAERARTSFGAFPPIPDIPEAADAPVLIIRDRKVAGRIAAERHYPKLPDYTRFDPILGQASDGAVYAMFQENHVAYSEGGDARAQRPTFIASTDGGRSWKMRQLELDPLVGREQAVRGFGVAAGDTLFTYYSPVAAAAELEELKRRIRSRMAAAESDYYADHILTMWNPLALYVSHSADRGRTWSKSVSVDLSQCASAGGLGRFCDGADGAVWFGCTLTGPEKHDLQQCYSGVFRSRDGGKSWGEMSAMVPGSNECTLLRLHSGRWLAAIRTSGLPGDRLTPAGKRENIYALDEAAVHKSEAERGALAHKRLFMAESEEGQQWTNVRQLTTLIGDTPGEFVQVPDGRIAFIYCHRYDPQAGVYARVSRDAGRTWDPSLLALRTAPCGGYPSSTVFGDGTILTLTGFSEEGRVQAIRWRLPDDEERAAKSP